MSSRCSTLAIALLACAPLVRSTENRHPLRPQTRAQLEIVLGHLEATLAEVEEGQRKESLRQSVTELRVRLDGLEGSGANVESISKGPFRDSALMNLARWQAEAGEFVPARKTIGEIESRYDSDWALGWVAQEMAEAGRVNDALTTMGEIENPQSRSDSMKLVGLLFARRGQWAVAEQTLAQAAESAEQIECPSDRAVQLMSVARMQKWAGQEISMQQTLAWVQAAIEQVENPEVKDRLLGSLAALQTRVGQEGEALVTEGDINDPEHRWEPRATRAAEQARQGNAAGALAIIDSADAAVSEEETNARAWALERVVAALLNDGDFEAARAAIERMPLNHPARAHRLAWMALALWWHGRDAEAEQSFEEALETAERVEDPAMRDQALRIVTENLGQSGQTDRALSVVAQIEREGERSNAFDAIARSQGRRGEIEPALGWILQVEDPTERAQALVGLAHGLVALDQYGPPRNRRRP